MKIELQKPNSYKIFKYEGTFIAVNKSGNILWYSSDRKNWIRYQPESRYRGAALWFLAKLGEIGGISISYDDIQHQHQQERRFGMKAIPPNPPF